MTLCDLSIGSTGTITFVESDDRALRRHILDMGLTPGTCGGGEGSADG